ncbi:hypothetical protein BA065_03340 [Nanoarchaeota archaeon NZ13-N]|nr:MAG: hypothetical protein BA065_03340 [Nanoarchaeota archaeon NZ13-N]
MEQPQELSKEEINKFLGILDNLNTKNYINWYSSDFRKIASKSEKIYNIVLFGFGKRVHDLQRFYYTHVYVFYPSMHWVSGDGDSSFRREEHNAMIDILLFKHPELLDKVETVLIAMVGRKLVGWKWDRYIFFYEAIGMNYDFNIISRIERNKNAWYFELDGNNLVLNMRDNKIVLIKEAL